VNPNLHKPPWLKIKPAFGSVYTEVKNLLKDLNLHTVCQEASCPNIGECFSARTATFIIMGDKCTRNCRFCGVTSGKPQAPDCNEPERVALAVKKLNLQYAVITSVTRDDLPDGGASIFAGTIKQIRRLSPTCKVEILIPDFLENHTALDTVLEAGPEVLAHNLETVPELYRKVRPQADYNRSLQVLGYAAEASSKTIIKSGIMVGLGETIDQLERVLIDSVRAGCKMFTIGQYLSPSKTHLNVEKYYTPEEFDILKQMGERHGILHVESGPLVRSSYMAHRQAEKFFTGAAI
jgi:lipoic acid synthetase